MKTKAKDGCRWDLVALGEGVLRLDPRDKRIWTVRRFDVYEGGGGYNVARSLKRCFSLDAAIVNCVADNPIGRLLQDLIYPASTSHSFAGSKTMQSANGCGTDSISWIVALTSARPSAVPRVAIPRFLNSSPVKSTGISSSEKQGAPWFHAGGIFSALSEMTAFVAEEAMKAAHRHGAIVS